MSLSARSFAWLAVGLLFACGTTSAAVTYSDTEFLPADWGFETVTLGTGGTSTPTQVGGGNPGNARQLFNTVSGGAGGGTIYGFSRYGTTNTVGRYDPLAQGPILSIDWSLDSRWVSGVGGQGQAIMLGAKQGQTVYSADFDLTGSSGAWTSHGALGLVAADFQPLITGSPAINFSSSGAPLRFGFIVANSGANPYSITVMYDNFNVRIVPTPTAAALLGLGAAAGVRRRKTRR